MSLPPPTDYSVITMHLALRPFHPRFATTIASWIESDRDLLWLAPRTLPPMTPQKVLAWDGPRNNLFLLYERGDDHPCAYGEVNELQKKPNHLWLGHIIVAPEQRRRGIATRFVDLLLSEAFDAHAANTVSLIVFRDNQPAAQCYVKRGFVSAGDELHRFRTGDKRHRMIRMDITRKRWNTIRSAANIPIHAT